MVEKISNGWAGTRNEDERKDFNLKKYDGIKHKFKVLKKKSYPGCVAMTVEAYEDTTPNEVLLFADEGNLSFGGKFIGNEHFLENTSSNSPITSGKYFIKIWTD